jgi:hypothetical protein
MGGMSPYRTQPVTAGDIRRGTIRIPPIVGPTKRLFPLERGRVEVNLRGSRKTRHWHPTTTPTRSEAGSSESGLRFCKRT